LLYTYLGLVLFLCGVNSGFAPVGAFLGKKLASITFNWILVPLGMWLIFYKVLAVNIPMGVLDFLKDLVDMI